MKYCVENNLDLFDKFLGYYNKNGELIGYLLILLILRLGEMVLLIV